MQIYKAGVHGNAPIYFGEETRELLVAQIDEAAPDKVFIVSDRTIELLYVEEIREQLPYSIPVETIVFNDGEENKNLATLQHVAGDLIRAGVTQDSLILNLGGGTVLNMGGLAASLLLHGVRFAHVATSFTAGWRVVTSNHQAINFVGEKNSLGTYCSPLFSIVDPYFLESEPERQVLAGLVDFLRFALVHGGHVYDTAAEIFSRDGFHKLPALAATQEACLKSRLAQDEADPAESNDDAADSYGATVGRALGRLSEGRLLPGEADYYGMLVAGELALQRGLMSAEESRRHASLLGRLSLDTPFPTHVRTDRLIYQLHGNNKTEVDGLEMMLLEGIGRVAGAEQGGLRARVTLTDADVAGAIVKVRGRG